MAKMMFLVMVYLQLCTEFITDTTEEPYQLRNAYELESFENEILLDFNEYSLAFASENEDQSNEDTQLPIENDIETYNDNIRIKRMATVGKKLSPSENNQNSSKNISTKKSTPSSEKKNKNLVLTPRPSTTMRTASLAIKPTALPSKVTTKRTRSSTEKARDDDSTLSEPKLVIDDKDIANFTFYSRVNESLNVVCQAGSGIIEWRGLENPFINKPIVAEPIGKTKLVLKFKSVALENEGNYTCKVYENSTTHKKSFNLKVIDPVQIIEFPQNLTTSEGDNITLQCKTSGHPKAITNWSFNETLSNGSTRFIRIVDQTNFRYKLDGDNLLVNNITLQEAGRYMCEAKQDIEKGTTDNKTVDVIVQHKPFSMQNFITLEAAFNSIVEIPCKVISNPAANYTWFRKIDDSYQNVSLSSPDPILKINLTNSSQYGEYKCQASNSLGYNEQYILLNPKEFLQPVKIEFINATESAVYFKVIPDSDSYVTNYKVQYKKRDATNWINRTITLSEISDIKHTLTNLTEKTNYILRLRSVNEFGISGPSNEIEFTTKELPTPPKIKIKILTNNLVSFYDENRRNSALIKYKAEYKKKGAKNWKISYFTIPKGATSNTKYCLGILHEKTIYILRVRSVTEAGASAPSDKIEFNTFG